MTWIVLVIFLCYLLPASLVIFARIILDGMPHDEKLSEVVENHVTYYPLINIISGVISLLFIGAMLFHRERLFSSLKNSKRLNKYDTFTLVATLSFLILIIFI